MYAKQWGKDTRMMPCAYCELRRRNTVTYCKCKLMICEILGGRYENDAIRVLSQPPSLVIGMWTTSNTIAFVWCDVHISSVLDCLLYGDVNALHAVRHTVRYHTYGNDAIRPLSHTF